MTAISSGPLAGRRALVTGGSRGIGAAIVRRLTADGAHVAFTFKSSTAAAEDLCAEVRESGGVIAAIAADSADPTEVGIAVDSAVAALGGLDILVNNVGAGHIAPIDSYSQEKFDEMVAINLSGTFAFIHHALPHLAEGARIINIGSINAERVQSPGLAVYAMTKGAIASLTRGMARDLGPRGITVNNVQPGPVATSANPDEGDHADLSRSIMALGRYGATDEVASVVSFLSGPESAYVTGANWNVDGGFTV
ncbi:3-ketoacyl-ACP reductase [Acrocarpospora pleiomorpha]|uniref:3-ketoacyl-ACP reductase n=1 Tax=Acrocarpospora pleiomorpha TaxID=90975 RepID=A0A5M3XDE8_9ACTN|nr:SDR family oxidoreductase [Acrocarpospora pleiomorpha]GES19655.1 3-ketoacyl-ACP reductase [Acrocarpospora pleiomorpha]